MGGLMIDGYRLVSICGLALMIFIAFLCSRNRKAIQWETVGWGIGLQVLFAVLVLKTDFGRMLFGWCNSIVVKLFSFQQTGGEMVFGALAIPPDQEGSLGFFFAFQVLTTIIFFSSLISILYHLGVMQWVVIFFAKAMKKFLRTSGAETLAASANIFVGQTEAPLIVRPFLKGMTSSELLCMMVGGMATVAAGIIGAYVLLLNGVFPNIAGHLLAASFMSAPASIAIAKILLPETKKPETAGTIKIINHEKNANVLEAAASGASVGLKMALNVGTMLVAFMALLALFNAILGWGGSFIDYPELTIQKILGYACAPLAFVMGTPWQDCQVVGELIGEKTVLNELVAYFHLADILNNNTTTLHPRSIVIATYALTGFSNFMSIGIQVGGIGSIVPERKTDLARLGFLALIGGSLACFMTACIAGILV